MQLWSCSYAHDGDDVHNSIPAHRDGVRPVFKVYVEEDGWAYWLDNLGVLPVNRYKYKVGINDLYRTMPQEHNLRCSTKEEHGLRQRASAIHYGGHLASISSEGENQFIYELAVQPSSNEYGPMSQLLWIGGRQDPSTKKWSWSDGEPWSYTNWDLGEPNNFKGQEHCVQALQTVKSDR
ncbi:lectin C-type domain protein [Cooperia oncophora]